MYIKKICKRIKYDMDFNRFYFVLWYYWVV